MKILAALLILQAPIGGATSEWSNDSCGVALEHAYSFFSVGTQSATQGDFNGDGQADFAFLLAGKTRPNKAAIGVCLSNEPRPLLITSPYQSTHIFTKPKGTPYMDFETEIPGRYELDSIAVSDGGWIGASYILRAGVFVQIIDGD